MDVRVGFIGLGDIGKPMALSIRRAGFPLLVYDLRPEPLADLAAAGAGVATSPHEVAAGCDVVAIVVLNHAQVEQVLVGEGGALPALGPGKTVLVMCTIAYTQTRRFAALVEATGARYLDAPVSGGVVRAAKGDLTIMVGGPGDVLESCRPVLQAMGTTIYHVGKEIGAGQVAKMANNMLCGVNLVAAMEAMVLAVKAGADPQAIYDVVTHSTGNSLCFENRINRVMERDFTSLKGALRTLHKDMGIVMTVASELQVPLMLAPLSYQLYQRAMLDGLDREDDTAVAKVIERLAGVEVRKAEAEAEVR